MNQTPPQETADVCLLLEGTYPYVMGGVSAWVDQMVQELPEITFTLFYIGSKRSQRQTAQYAIPSNVISLQEIYLLDALPESELKPAPLPKPLRRQLYSQLREFYETDSTKTKAKLFRTVFNTLSKARGHFTFGNLLHDREAWDILTQCYRKLLPDESFIDFFWTIRFLHLPLWQLWRRYPKIPKARLYNSVSTGYAGLMGTLAAWTHKAPLILSEHGIYTKERIVEISKAEWIYEAENRQIVYSEGMGKLKQLWIDLFMLLGQLAYDQATIVTTLYKGNRNTQIDYGAQADKISVVPNGINPELFDSTREIVSSRWQTEPPRKTVGFMGRVVPIKDIKTLVRAAGYLCESCNDVDFKIAGPDDEDPNYAENCKGMVGMLGLTDRIHFLGRQDLAAFLPEIDVLVLTSISEGLPLVILEAMAAGIPIVATDVGACRELIFGRTPEDSALGQSGLLTKIMAPKETSDALCNIITNPKQWRSFSEVGVRRVNAHYTMSKLVRTFRGIYSRYVFDRES